ncbi:MAG: RluA family pseudouridine synthase [Myxococcales bacterium]|jgi:23S rRNA pseudouridine1911/1915/1917 synthase
MTNSGWEYREQVGVHARGLTVLAYLAARYRRASAQAWAERIARGEVLVDGEVATGEEALRPGQLLCWRRPPWTEPEVPLRFELVYEDDDLLVVSKPSGLPTMPAGGQFLQHTLLALVHARDPEAAPMHRLGRGTSGLVVFGRTAHARSKLQSAWRDHRVEKVYRALTSGELPAEPFVIDAPIGRVAHPALGSLNAATSAGKPAWSEVRRVKLCAEGSIAEVRIATGRAHQIRIHLAFAGHPLVGDPLYGPGGIPRADALPGDLGYQLHAWRLALEHPRTGRPLQLEAPLPASLQ